MISLSLSTLEILDYQVWFQIKQLILLLILVFQMGYYYGLNKRYQRKKCHTYHKINNVLPLEYKPDLQLHLVNDEHKALQLTKQGAKQIEIQQNKKLNAQSNEPIINPKPEEQISREFLQQKITLQGNRIQSRGTFHMTFQKCSNPKFLRKIQKHQIITDYQMHSSQNDSLIPFGSKKFLSLSDDTSILQINTYQNKKAHKYPVLQKRIIKTNQFNHLTNKINIPMSGSLCQNGKFRKFFGAHRKIGEGAFGTVYRVRSIFEAKDYAIKKLFIKTVYNRDKMNEMLNQSIKEVNIISQYSHPNIIRFHTCWLQMANLNQSISFNKRYFKQSSVSDIDIKDTQMAQQQSRLNFKKKKSIQSYIQISYISSQADSNIGFQQVSHATLPNDNPFSTPSQNQPQKSNQSLTNIKETVPIFVLYIQMQLCQEGSLDGYLNRRRKVDRKFAFIVIRQLIHGVSYLHQCGLVHRDLKPANILINKKERTIKIADFGLSANIQDDIQYGKIGTPSYIAPEVLQKKPIRKQDLALIDIYSIGVIFFQLLNLFNLSTKHEKLLKINNLKQGLIQLNPQYKFQKKLIKLMTKTKGRPSIKQIQQRKEYIQLKEMVEREQNITSSWDEIKGQEQNQAAK